MTSLHPNHLWVLRIRFVIAALVLAPALIWADYELVKEFAVPAGATSGAGAVLLLAMIFLMPRRRYAAWGYTMGEDELAVKHGLMIRKLTIVPFGRVQHIDTARGPLQRMFGLATLVLNTAGTRGAAVRLPGLQHEDAESIRDEIRSKIRQDLL